MKTYILWDLDGTLIDSDVTLGGVHLTAIALVTGATPTVALERLPHEVAGEFVARLLEANGHSRSLVESTLFQIDSLARARFVRDDAREILGGVTEALDAVEALGHTNALLTSNGDARARFSLLARGIDPARFDWQHSYFGDDSPARTPLAEGEQAVAIGDAPLDAQIAASARIPFIAVATGLFSTTRLRQTEAIEVLDDLSDTQRLRAAITAAVDGFSTTPTLAGQSSAPASALR